MSLLSWFGNRKRRPGRDASRSPSIRDARRRNARRLLLEPLEDRSLLAFLPLVNFSAGDAPEGVVAADFDNDGDADLATANNAASSVSILFNLGGGSYGAATSFATGPGPLAVAAGDFDGDGDNDLVTANGPGNNVSILLNQGSGAFGAPANFTAGSYPSSIALGDFNEDGKLDVATSNFYTNNASVLLGNGDGTLQAPTNLLTYWSPEGIAAGDFNNDQNLDLVTAGSGINTFLGNGAGGFQAVQPVVVDPTSVAVGDVTGDGKLDLVTAATMYYGGGGGCDYYGCWGGYYYSVGRVQVLIGSGDGNFNWGPSFNLNGIYPTGVAIADVNGDSLLDFAVSVSDTNAVSTFINGGDGSYFNMPDIAVGASPSGIIATDLSGDGMPDLAVTNYGSDNVSVLINADDWAPWLWISDTSITEGNGGTSDAVFTVNIWPSPEANATVNYNAESGSATVGDDFLPTSGTLTFVPGGATTQTISVPIVGDTLPEYWGESFYVNLTSPSGAVLSDATGIGQIYDDEPTVYVENSPTVTEGHDGTTDAVFTVRLSAPSSDSVTVNFTTADLNWWDCYYYCYESATAGTDYVTQASSVTIPAGETQATVSVPVLGDRVGENDEGFKLQLLSSDHAQVADYGNLGVIVDDEPRAWIGSASVNEGDAGTVQAVFNVTLSAASTEPVTVSYATVDGSYYGATAPSDYAAATGTLTFAPGQTTLPISIAVNGDTIAEAAENFYVRLTGTTGAMISGEWGYGTIVDDDTAPAITIGDAYVFEGNSGTTLMTFTVYLSQTSGKEVRVNFATANSTAKTSDKDYVAKSGTLIFAPGEYYKTITITINGDTKRENDERFYINLSGAVNATISDNRAVGTIRNDDKRN